MSKNENNIIQLPEFNELLSSLGIQIPEVLAASVLSALSECCSGQSLSNKDIVYNASNALKDLNIKIKLTQVYELFSRLAGYPNWNIAKANNVSFANLLSPKKNSYSGEIDTWLSKIASGEWRNKIVLGVQLETNQFIVVDPDQFTGQACIGAMGSGKSITQAFMTYTRLITNSENTFFIFVDSIRHMPDMNEAFRYRENVACAFGGAKKLAPLMSLLEEEIEARISLFNQFGVSNVYDYESIAKQNDSTFSGLARINLCMDEISALVTDKDINYWDNVNTPGTMAYQLKNLMRKGRSYGINVMATTFRPASECFPYSLKEGLSLMMLVHRLDNGGDANILELPDAFGISKSNRGEFLTKEYGKMKALLLDKEVVRDALKKYVKPLKAKLLTSQVSDYHAALSEPSELNFVALKRFKTKRLLEEWGFQVSYQEKSILFENMVATRDNRRYAVVTEAGNVAFTETAIEQLRLSLEALNCDSVISISLIEHTSLYLSKLCSELFGSTLSKAEYDEALKVIESRQSFIDSNLLSLYNKRLDTFPLSRVSFAKRK